VVVVDVVSPPVVVEVLVLKLELPPVPAPPVVVVPLGLVLHPNASASSAVEIDMRKRFINPPRADLALLRRQAPALRVRSDVLVVLPSQSSASSSAMCSS